VTENCPVLSLQPILREPDTRTLSYNYDLIVEWTRRMCAHLAAKTAELQAAIEASSGADGDGVGTDKVALPIASGGTDATNVGDAQNNLELTPGVYTQPYAANLTLWAGITPSGEVVGFLASPSLETLEGAIGEQLSTEDEASSLLRKFRLLLRAWITTGLPLPPGLEDEYEIALNTE